jgi:hypothetical protein
LLVLIGLATNIADFHFALSVTTIDEHGSLKYQSFQFSIKPTGNQPNIRTISKMSLPSTREGKFALYTCLVLYDSRSVDPKRANRGKNMAALIEEEALSYDGLPEKYPQGQRKRKRKRKQAKKVVPGEVRDNASDEDSDFSGSGDSDGSESDSNGSDGMIPNDEVSFSLLVLIEFYQICIITFFLPFFSDCRHAPFENSATYQTNQITAEIHDACKEEITQGDC